MIPKEEFEFATISYSFPKRKKGRRFKPVLIERSINIWNLVRRQYPEHAYTENQNYQTQPENA